MIRVLIIRFINFVTCTPLRSERLKVKMELFRLRTILLHEHTTMHRLDLCATMSAEKYKAIMK